MPTNPKTISKHTPNPRSGKTGLDPIRLNIPTIEEAEAALAAHQAKMIPHQAPAAPDADQQARAKWVAKKFELQTALRMAQGAEANKWKSIFEADPGPEPKHGKGWPHRKRRAA
jgi:hypothetical protein